MPATTEEISTRTALVRLTFPFLADAADREPAHRAALGLTTPGPATSVIRVDVTSPTLWHSGSNSAAEGLDGSWESYVELACRRIEPLKDCARRPEEG